MPPPRKSQQDIDVPRDPTRGGYEAAMKVHDEAEQAHVRDAHGGDPYDASTFECARCRELEALDEELERRFFSEP